MGRWLKFIVTEIVYNGHLQSLGSVGIVYFSSLLFGVTAGVGFLILVYLLFQTIYYFDRYRDYKIDKSTNKERSTHIGLYKSRIPLIIMVFVVLMVIGFLHYSNLLSLFTASGILLLGILYPIYFKGLTRKIPLFKNIYVGSVHGLLIFFPLVYYERGVGDTRLVGIGFLIVLFEAMISQFVLDLKDVLSDKKRGLKTLPVLLGIGNTVKVVFVMSIVSFIIFIYFGWAYSFVVFLVAIVTFLINMVVYLNIRVRPKVSLILAASRFFWWFCFLFLLSTVKII